MEENRIPKRVLYTNLGTKDWEVDQEIDGKMRWEEDGQIVGGVGWQEKVHNRGEWKKILRMPKSCRILHIPMEWMNKLHEAASLLRNHELLSYKLNFLTFMKHAAPLLFFVKSCLLLCQHSLIQGCTKPTMAGHHDHYILQGGG